MSYYQYMIIILQYKYFSHFRLFIEFFLIYVYLLKLFTLMISKQIKISESSGHLIQCLATFHVNANVDMWTLIYKKHMHMHHLLCFKTFTTHYYNKIISIKCKKSYLPLYIVLSSKFNIRIIYITKTTTYMNLGRWNSHV